MNSLLSIWPSGGPRITPSQQHIKCVSSQWIDLDCFQTSVFIRDSPDNNVLDPIRYDGRKSTNSCRMRSSKVMKNNQMTSAMTINRYGLISGTMWWAPWHKSQGLAVCLVWPATCKIKESGKYRFYFQTVYTQYPPGTYKHIKHKFQAETNGSISVYGCRCRKGNDQQGLMCHRLMAVSSLTLSQCCGRG